MFSQAVRVVIVCILIMLVGCQESEAPLATEPSARHKEDTLAERRLVAQEITRVFPTEYFMADLQQRISAIAGEEVAGALQEKLLSRIGVAALKEQRIEYLASNFTVAELSYLLGIYQSPTGSALLRKLPVYDEAWRGYLSPLIAEELSGSSGK